LAIENNIMAREYRISEAGRRALAERMQLLNADPEFASKRNAAASKTIRRLRAKPEFIAKLGRRRRIAPTVAAE
jgi:hypothetical protein